MPESRPETRENRGNGNKPYGSAALANSQPLASTRTRAHQEVEVTTTSNHQPWPLHESGPTRPGSGTIRIAVHEKTPGCLEVGLDLWDPCRAVRPRSSAAPLPQRTAVVITYRSASIIHPPAILL